MRAVNRATKATSTHGGQLADGVSVLKVSDTQVASVVRGDKKYTLESHHVDVDQDWSEIEPEDYVDYMKCTVESTKYLGGLYANRTELQRAGPQEQWEIISQTEGFKDSGEACAEAAKNLAG